MPFPFSDALYIRENILEPTFRVGKDLEPGDKVLFCLFKIICDFVGEHLRDESGHRELGK